MWAFIVRRILTNVPVYFGALLLVFLALRVQDPVYQYLGQDAGPEQYAQLKRDMGLDAPLPAQFGRYVTEAVTFDYRGNSWNQRGTSVGEILKRSVVPSLSITLPALLLSTLIGVFIALIAAYFRGRAPDKVLMIAAVLGMSISFLVYIIFGQFFFAAIPRADGWAVAPFAVQGYEPWIAFGEGGGLRPARWIEYCLLPVMISVIVSMGYDTRFYRAVMVEETRKDYIRTARAKGCSTRRVMLVHMLKNAMIPIITRIMISLPFVVTGSILVEYYFNIPGMGRTLINAIRASDFPVIQTFTALFAALFIASNILTDVLYAVADPRVRLS